MQKKVLAIILGFFMIFAANAVMAGAIDGSWIITVALEDGGGGDVNFEFKEAGGKITGSYSGTQGSDLLVTGTLKGNKIEWSFEGMDGKIAYSGEVLKDGTLKGTCEYACCGAGQFTGMKGSGGSIASPPPPPPEGGKGGKKGGKGGKK
ncbi:MAG: hypothetical protein JRI86_13730 [Deltaproteobacteria bacterium]|nr:hypothetical protein [Deltaproteobacteria bacterium]